MLAVDGTTMAGIVLAILAWIAVATLVIWLISIPVRRMKVAQENEWRSRQPGRAPIGIPDRKTSAKGYGWLARNEYGAIDMSTYTMAQWLDTKLKYCKRHHKHPGEALHVTTIFDEHGNAYWADPCDCGKVMGIIRAVICRDGLWGQWLTATGTYAALNGINKVFANADDPLHGISQSLRGDMEFGAAAYGAVGLRNVALRNLVKKLIVHPEIDGIWVKSKALSFEKYCPRHLWHSFGPIPQDRRWDGERWTVPYYPPQPEPEIPATWGGPTGLTWGKEW